MSASQTRIVLVGTTHPGNIGAAARALKTMGLSRLYLVSPRTFPDDKAFEMAAGADDLLREAVVCTSLEEAIADCQLVIGSSARSRHVDLQVLTPDTCASLVHAQSATTETAIVFGCERSGLTNEELLRCHYHVAIPANPAYSSLNLAQAVQIIAYEWYIKSLAVSSSVSSIPQQPLKASVRAVEHFYKHLHQALVKINFLKPSNQKVFNRIRRLFNRVGFEEDEMQMMHGILSQITAYERTELPQALNKDPHDVQ